MPEPMPGGMMSQGGGMAGPEPLAAPGVPPVADVGALAQVDALPAPPRRRVSRRKSIRLDKTLLAETVLRDLQTDQDSRADWMEKRILRYAKYRGWLESSDDPWPDSFNPQIPVILWNVLRLQAQLHNAVLSTRPVMTPMAWKKQDKEKEERVANLLDFQVFVEAGGAKALDSYIQGYVEDGPSVMHIPWVTETRKIHEVKVFPKPEEGMPDLAKPIPPGLPDREYFARLIQTLLDPVRKMVPDDQTGYDWTVLYIEDTTGESVQAEISFAFRDDGRVEMAIQREATVYNGPGLFTESLEDIVIPWGACNLQPAGPSNPKGASRVTRLSRVRLDEVRRRAKDGTYDALTKADLKSLLDGPQASPQNQQSAQREGMRSLKDAAIGTTPQGGTGAETNDGEETEGNKSFTAVEQYRRWDVDGDGLEEDVIVTVLLESKLVARVRYLTEIFPPGPGLLPRRPFAEAHFMPAKDSWYSMGMIELLEHLADLINGVTKMNLDWGTITNSPFFFYRPSSGLKPETISLYPGEGYPVENPAQDVYFPQMPHADQAWAFNLATMFNQMVERLAMQGELQYGRVPQGKASALRTMGTTVSLMQQSDVRSDQILLRLFEGVAEIYQQIHALNQRYLPANKEYRIVGVPPKGQESYQRVNTVDEISGRYDFQWKATLLSADKNALPQTLMEIGSVLMSPFTMASGLVDKEKAYTFLRDYIKSRHQDPDRYLIRPPEATDAPKFLAEEALSMLIEGEKPEGIPHEQAAVHLGKLLEFAKSDAFGMFPPEYVPAFRQWLMQVRTLAIQEAQRAQMLQMASQMQTLMAGNQQGPPGSAGMVPNQQPQMGPGANPPVQTNELLQEELQHG
jgi:hypothetical protein